MITYLKDKKHKSKNKHKKYKKKITIIKSFDTMVIFAKTSSSTTLSVTGIGVFAIQISAATACRL